MKNLIKYVAAGAAVYALYYFFVKKNKTQNVAPSNNTNSGIPTATEVGSNATQTRTTIEGKDTTIRRCIDENGKTVYVKGPCPTHAYVIAASYGSR